MNEAPIEVPVEAPAPVEAATPAPAQDSVLGALVPPEEPKPAEPVVEETPVEPPKAEETPPPEEIPQEEPPQKIEYQDFTLPEGVTADLSKFKEIASEAKVPQEAAQKLLDLYADERRAMEVQQREVWDRMRADWRDQIKSDPEIGGNRMQTVMDKCINVISRFGSPELKEMMNLTGAGDNPAMVRFVAKIADALGEGKPVPAPAAPPVPKESRANRRYSKGK